MKELSIEEKARAYDEALERAKNYWKSPRTCFDIDALTEMFPELKDTDDTIRRELIKYFEHYSGGDTICIKFPEWIAWLEKQGEQILANSAKTCKDEQKPANKVEPKFKVGDWVRAISSGNIFKILSVNDGLYRVLCYDGVEANYPIEEVEKDLTYWTIQDAKDGDVLNSPSHRLVWIYKDKEHYYACVNMNYVAENVTTDGLISIPNDTCPATKDERTILFEKIKEAGYEWNAEKKELNELLSDLKKLKGE